MNDFIANIFTTEGFTQMLSWLLFILQVVYIVYAFIVTREVAIMNKHFKTAIGPVFSLIAYIHLFAAILILIITFIALR